jgi:hypothetical protein
MPNAKTEDMTAGHSHPGTGSWEVLVSLYPHAAIIAVMRFAPMTVKNKKFASIRFLNKRVSVRHVSLWLSHLARPIVANADGNS